MVGVFMNDQLAQFEPDHTILVDTEAATLQVGWQLGQALVGGEVIFLEGDLGAGKTTLSRAIIRALGHVGEVKSPTYTLVEPYEHLAPVVYHFDLYRLKDSEELLHIGIDDYFSQNASCLIEWPSKGAGFLPEPDLRLTMLTQAQSAASSDPSLGRQLQVKVGSDRGRALLVKILREMNPS